MKILAVDDEKIALQGLLHCIEKAVPTASVSGFRYAGEAIAFMEENHCDVAFLDIEMKGMSGVELAERLKAINPEVNIIFSTGFGSYRDVAFDMHASGYLIKPITTERVKHELENLRRPVATGALLQIRTFGNFEVFRCGVPLAFKYQKSKEIFAYLVDRKGAMCTTGEIMTVIFEDDNDHKAYYHRLRADLLETLAACGCGDVITQARGMLGISTELVECDYYDYLNGKAELKRIYNGEYMAQYSFAEITNAELFAKLRKQ